MKQIKSTSLKLRWLNAQCFEIKLPNGKTILTDPTLRDPLPDSEKGRKYKIPDFSIDQLEGADYIIINHTHGDHIMDVGEVCKRFGSVVICHERCALELADFFDIPYTSVFPVSTNDRYDFGDFVLDCYHGMHRAAPEKPSDKKDPAMRDFGVPGMVELGHLGSIFNFNFVITTRENFKIGFSAGDYFEDLAEKWKNIRPNLVLRHRLKKGDSAVKLFADVLEKTGAQILMPMHHEDWVLDDPGYTEECMNAVNVLMEQKGISGRAFSQQRCKWYEIALGIQDVND